jgi:hypothetical protein
VECRDFKHLHAVAEMARGLPEVGGEKRKPNASGFLQREANMWLLILLILLFVLSIGGGGWGYSRYSYWSLSPAAVILIVVMALVFTGHLHWM